jgi:hypothetical protein
MLRGDNEEIEINKLRQVVNNLVEEKMEEGL